MTARLCNWVELKELSDMAAAEGRNCPTVGFFERLDQTRRYALAPLPGFANGYERDWTRCQIIHPLEALVMLDVRNEQLEELLELKLPLGSKDIAVIGGAS